MKRRWWVVLIVAFVGISIATGAAVVPQVLRSIDDVTNTGIPQFFAITKQLEAQKTSTPTLDLERLPGNWSKVVIACPGSSHSEIESALGVPWRPPADADDDNMGVIIFATDRHVVDSYWVGSDFYQASVDDNIRLFLCPGVIEPQAANVLETQRPVVIERKGGQIPFTRAPGDQYWFMTQSQFDSLR